MSKNASKASKPEAAKEIVKVILESALVWRDLNDVGDRKKHN